VTGDLPENLREELLMSKRDKARKNEQESGPDLEALAVEILYGMGTKRSSALAEEIQRGRARRDQSPNKR
jgi:hypothetical protein